MSGERKPFGPAAAAFLAAGAACLALGLLAPVTGLDLMPKVGPLSGQTMIPAAVFFVAWKGLAFFWKERDPPTGPVFAATFAMIACGLVLTFPPVFHLF
jgi:hypothetical protein